MSPEIIDTREEIARRVIPGIKYDEWAAADNGYTTQAPAIACIGPAGENRSQIASIVHGAGSSGNTLNRTILLEPARVYVLFWNSNNRS